MVARVIERKEKDMHITRYIRGKGETIIAETADRMCKGGFDNIRKQGHIYLNDPNSRKSFEAWFTTDDIYLLEFITKELKRVKEERNENAD